MINDQKKRFRNLQNNLQLGFDLQKTQVLKNRWSTCNSKTDRKAIVLLARMKNQHVPGEGGQEQEEETADKVLDMSKLKKKS